MSASQRGARITALPDSALVAIFKLLPPAERRHALPLVCRRFREVASTSSQLWAQVSKSLWQPAVVHYWSSGAWEAYWHGCNTTASRRRARCTHRLPLAATHLPMPTLRRCI